MAENETHSEGWGCGGRIKCPACCAAPTPDANDGRTTSAEGGEAEAWEQALMRGHDEIHRLCRPGENWRMTIPANPQRDSDLILSDVLDALEAEIKGLKAHDAARDAEPCPWCKSDPEALADAHGEGWRTGRDEGRREVGERIARAIEAEDCGTVSELTSQIHAGCQDADRWPAAECRGCGAAAKAWYDGIEHMRADAARIAREQAQP